MQALAASCEELLARTGNPPLHQTILPCSISVSADRLKLLLSFAVGGLLGDVFLHLLPEAFGPVNAGKLVFFFTEFLHKPFEIHFKTNEGNKNFISQQCIRTGIKPQHSHAY